MNEQQRTQFRITAETLDDNFNMEFAIPVAITRSDWEEIARMMKQVSVILSKLPVDPTVMNNLTDEIITTTTK